MYAWQGVARVPQTAKKLTWVKTGGQKLKKTSPAPQAGIAHDSVEFHVSANPLKYSTDQYYRLLEKWVHSFYANFIDNHKFLYFRIIYLLYQCFTCTYICIPQECLVLMEVRRQRKCWKQNPGPLCEHQALTEPSLQPRKAILWDWCFTCYAIEAPHKFI